MNNTVTVFYILLKDISTCMNSPLYISPVVCNNFFTLSILRALTSSNPLVHSAKAFFITFSKSLSSFRISSSLYSRLRTIQFAFNAVRSSAYGTFLSLVNLIYFQSAVRINNQTFLSNTAVARAVSLSCL